MKLLNLEEVRALSRVEAASIYEEVLEETNKINITHKTKSEILEPFMQMVMMQTDLEFILGLKFKTTVTDIESLKGIGMGSWTTYSS